MNARLVLWAFSIRLARRLKVSARQVPNADTYADIEDSGIVLLQ